MILERIKEYLDFKGITIAAFEKSIGMGNASFRKALLNGGAIGTDKLEKILSVYVDLSPLWVVSGRGTMTENGDDEDAAKDKAIVQLTLENIRLKERISDLQSKGAVAG